MRRLGAGLLLLGALASLASSRGRDDVFFGETGFFGREDTAAEACDDELEALCVTTRQGQTGAPADSVQVQDAEHVVVEDLTCGLAKCCSEDLAGGSYVVVAELDGQTVAELVAVPSYEGCPETETLVEITFEEGE